MSRDGCLNYCRQDLRLTTTRAIEITATNATIMPIISDPLPVFVEGVVGGADAIVGVGVAVAGKATVADGVVDIAGVAVADEVGVDGIIGVGVKTGVDTGVMIIGNSTPNWVEWLVVPVII